MDITPAIQKLLDNMDSQVNRERWLERLHAAILVVSEARYILRRYEREASILTDTNTILTSMWCETDEALRSGRGTRIGFCLLPPNHHQ